MLTNLARFDVVVLCAREIQPPSSHFSLWPCLTVLRCPLDDNDLMGLTEDEERMTAVISHDVRLAVENNRRTLVTCHLGINRSSLVTAMALTQLTGCSGEDCVRWVRRRRPGTFTNQDFVRRLQRIPRRRNTPCLPS